MYLSTLHAAASLLTHASVVAAFVCCTCNISSSTCCLNTHSNATAELAEYKLCVLQVTELQNKHSQELKQVQARVQTAVAAKDDTIAALKKQLSDLTQRLQSTEAVLHQQQAELC